MATEAPILRSDELFSGKDRTLQFAVVDAAGVAVNITGWALRWVLASRDRRTIYVSKTVGSGITITNGAGGICQVALLDTDTDALIEGEYYHELSRTTDGSEDVLSYGAAELQCSPTAA